MNNTEKFDIYEMITNLILNKLKEGIIPWQKPWNAGISPTNLVSKKAYRGINTWLLMALDFESPYYLSFKQVGQLGGKIKKGEKGSVVVFWKLTEVHDRDTGEIKKIPFLKYYKVFNLEQTEGIDTKKIPADTKPACNEFQAIENCETVLAEADGANLLPKVIYGKKHAYYRPSIDEIHMPEKTTFNSGEEFYSTFFHEIIHSTGHKDRLNRDSLTNYAAFGSHLYSKEELIAEMGASFLCGVTGIANRTIDNSTAYIQSWLRKFKNDPKMIIYASSMAQKAADFVLGIKPITEKESN
jgi:antirestriction protein ArdC